MLTPSASGVSCTVVMYGCSGLVVRHLLLLDLSLPSAVGDIDTGERIAVLGGAHALI